MLVARVGATLSVPMLKGMKYKMLDWHFRTIKEGTISNGKLVIPGNLPVFMIELNR